MLRCWRRAFLCSGYTPCPVLCSASCLSLFGSLGGETRSPANSVRRQLVAAPELPRFAVSCLVLGVGFVKVYARAFGNTECAAASAETNRGTTRLAGFRSPIIHNGGGTIYTPCTTTCNLGHNNPVTESQ